MSSLHPQAPRRARPGLHDVLASLVVFLVALPLCIGIAVACGVPPERGLVTGIIGGIIVGLLSGAPLLVSGPAASLIVLVFDLVESHGLSALGPVVVAAGAWQLVAGLLMLGQWFRAVAPAVIHGMLIGIGVLIFVSQLLVALDAEPQASLMANVVAFPQQLVRAFAGHDGASPVPFFVSASTIALMVLWNRFRPERLAIIPGHLVSLVTVAAVTVASGAEVAFLDISSRFFDGLQLATFADFRLLADLRIIGLSLVFAFVASAATLLTANAIDERQSYSRANYDREMAAQGVGNMVTGLVGGLPMTGVIVRSSVNVDAGARTRLSTVLHGIWILAMVSVVPEVLELVPRAGLGAILVYTGYKLIDTRALVALHRQGRAELAIALLTLAGVVFLDLFSGILLGLAAAVAKIVYTFARLELRSEPSPTAKVQHLHLRGSATFLHVPRLAASLQSVPHDRELHVHIDHLDHIDHACLQLLSSWNRRREADSLPGMVVEWDELTERYRSALVGAGARDSRPSPSLMSLVWAEWKRVYAPRRQSELGQERRWSRWLNPSRIRVRAPAKSLEEVIAIAAPLLAQAIERSHEEIEQALRSRVEDHVSLGADVSLPHAAIDGLREPIAALVITPESIAVGDDRADLFFVLLGPAGEPREHLQALAHVGRLCHETRLLDDLRDAASSEEAARLLAAFEESLGDPYSSATAEDRLLVVLEAGSEPRARHEASILTEAFGPPALLSPGDGPRFEVLRRVLRADRSSHLVVVSIDERDLAVLHALIDEESRLLIDDACRLHVLRRSG